MSMQITLEPETRTLRLLIEFRGTLFVSTCIEINTSENSSAVSHGPQPLPSLNVWEVVASLALVQINRYFGSHIWLYTGDIIFSPPLQLKG